jgi:hypothetical protein
MIDQKPFSSNPNGNNGSTNSTANSGYNQNGQLLQHHGGNNHQQTSPYSYSKELIDLHSVVQAAAVISNPNIPSVSASSPTSSQNIDSAKSSYSLPSLQSQHACSGVERFRSVLGSSRISPYGSNSHSVKHQSNSSNSSANGNSNQDNDMSNRNISSSSSPTSSTSSTTSNKSSSSSSLSHQFSTSKS